MSMMFPSYQLLELNIISAQDLAPVAGKTKTYAVAWVHSERKLTTRVDYEGGTNPTWNDKFIFRVNEEFLYADTSAVVIEIYAMHWFRDVHVGTVRVLVSNLIPPNRRPGYITSNNEYRRMPPPGMRFVALQVRRASGRPQGILNIGVGLLDGSMRSMPLYTNMDSSAVGYRDLLGEEDPHLQHLRLNSNKGSSKNPQSPSSKNPRSPSSKQYLSASSRPELRRTRSDSSSMVVSDLLSRAERIRLANRQPASALVSSESETLPTTTTDSDEKKLNKFSLPNKNFKSPRQRYDPIESNSIDPSPHDVQPYGSYYQSRKTPRRQTMNEKQGSVKDYDRGRAYPYLSKHGTPMRSNIIASTPMKSNIIAMSPMHPKSIRTPMRSNMVKSTPMRSKIIESTPVRSNYMTTPMKSHHEFNPPMKNLARRRILPESELSSSPSELTNKFANYTSNETESSILSEWSTDESSIEEVRSKLERWRMELPPLYDIGSSQISSSGYDDASLPAATAGGGFSSRRKALTAKKKHNRRHTDGGNGLFSCFSKICGVECSFVCGGGGGGGPLSPNGSSNKTSHVHRTYSADDLSYL